MSDHEGRRLRLLQDGPLPPAEGLERRRFLTLVGASLALGGAAGCTRQPPERIVPYVREPEDATPGVSREYATSILHQGVATGLLVRSETGRPVKIEGNPDHPSSLGAADAFAQASILSLYDPDRARVSTHLGRILPWERASADLARAVSAERASGGAGIRILTETVTSPTLAAEIQGFLGDYPAARWVRWEAAGRHHTATGARLAFGAPLERRFDLTAADVIVTLESDLLAYGPGCLRYARDFALRRGAGQRSSRDRALPGAASRPVRLYSIESAPTCTGTVADHRLTVRPSEVAAFVSALGAELQVFRDGAVDVPPVVGKWAAAVAKDLRAHRGRSLVVAGEPAPPAIHALAAVLDDALGNVGNTVSYTDPLEVDPLDHLASLRELCDDMRAGRVSLLLILGGNPVYTAPADLDFEGALGRVATRVHLAPAADETTAHCHYHVPEAHFLEAWGDARAHDGTWSLVQPLLDPLYSGKTALEVVASLRGRGRTSGLDLVKARLGAGAPTGDLEEAFATALRDGFVRGSAFPARRADIAVDAAQRAALALAAAARDRGGYELCLRADPTVDDGRFASNDWLQELPKPHTALTWDNAAILSPHTAAELGVETGDVVELAREGRSATAAVLVLRGHPDATVTAHLGYGRRAGAPLAHGLGFDAYRMRTSQSLWHGPGLVIRRTGGRYPLATTQHHFTLEDRHPVRTASLAELRERPDVLREMGEEPPPSLSLYPPWDYRGRQWGMVVDTGACTGCSACVVACQAENNIPVVGKTQVLAGREMHWIRVDRYEIGAGDSPLVVHQPMMCVHCENAPCEYVCPVEATTHSPEGLNEMTYNRCVGTRYCSNNCPYKVRRFNFLDYHRGEAESLRLLRNPDVTVRSRGVMEKCTYCVQRIAAGRIAAEREGRPVRDGEIVTACQAACPTGAIVFGDIHDPASLVAQRKADPRAYGVLAELGTRPRTTYLGRVLNLAQELEDHG